MIKANEQQQLKINGARNFAQWITDRYGLPIDGMNNNISKWMEQLK